MGNNKKRFFSFVTDCAFRPREAQFFAVLAENSAVLAEIFTSTADLFSSHL